MKPRSVAVQEQGFTLLEVLVALAVLAVGAVSLLTATQTHISRISGIEARTVARWVAENQLSVLRLGLEMPPVVSAMGEDWNATLRRSATSDPDLVRVDISVAQASTGRVTFQLTGFIDILGVGAIAE